MSPSDLPRLLRDRRVCKLNGSELRVFLLLVAWSDKQARVQVSTSQIARSAQHTSGTVRRALQVLANVGLIYIHPVLGSNSARLANLYEVAPLFQCPPLRATTDVDGLSAPVVMVEP